MTLTEFLSRASRRPFVWGRWDCLMWLAEWVRRCGRGDPGRGWRRRYRSACGAARIVAEAGGIVAHMERCLAPLGVARTDAPRRGDIAAVASDVGTVGAIVLAAPEDGGRVCLTACLMREGGVSIGYRAVMAAWRIAP